MATSRDEVFEKVRAVLTDALGVDDDEVTPEATLFGDLGAESIDILDIVFRLEKAFGFKIPKGELFPEELLNNPAYRDGDRITEAGMAKIKSAMPHTDFSQLEQQPLVANLSNLFTVNAVVNYVNSKLATVGA